MKPITENRTHISHQMNYTFLLFVLLFLSSAWCQQSIVLSEDFESPALSVIVTRWNDVSNLGGMSLSNDVPRGSTGKQSLMVTSVIGQNTGGHLYKMFDRGYDSLYYRFSVKFAVTCHPVHHFVHIGGYNPPTRWAQGGAGIRPTGNERFSSGIEPMGNRWEWDFYSYWMHMRGNPQPNMYWGNDFNPIPAAKIKRGEWMRVDAMMKLNNPPTSFNGEQALWIDGRKIMHLKQGSPNGYWVWDSFHPHPDSAAFEGFQWRSDPNLKLNFFWLMLYMTQGTQGQIDTVWFDDVLVSTTNLGIPTSADDHKQRSHTFELQQNYPNPFTESTAIDLTPTLSYEERELRVFDHFGRVVLDLSDAVRETSSGENPRRITIHKSQLPKSGVYFYQLRTASQSQTKMMMRIE